MIDINFTAVIQFINFIITLIVLNALLIKPVREAIAKRRAKMADFVADANLLTAKAQESLAQYNKQLDSAKDDAMKSLSLSRDDARKIADSITSSAQNDAMAYIHSSIEANRIKCDDARKQMDEHMPEFLQVAYSKLVLAS